MRSILTIEKHFSGEFVLGFIEGGGSPTFLSHIAGGRSVRLFLKVWKALEGTQSPLLAVNPSDEVRHLPPPPNLLHTISKLSTSPLQRRIIAAPIQLEKLELNSPRRPD